MPANPVPRESSVLRTQPPSAVVGGQPAMADASSQTPAHSLRMQLAALMGVLALVSFLGRVGFKLGAARRRRKARARRDAIWQRTDKGREKSRDKGRIARSARSKVAPRRPVVARDLDRPENPGDSIEELLSQLSRRAAT
jgi:hypothetical protein